MIDVPEGGPNSFPISSEHLDAKPPQESYDAAELDADAPDAEQQPADPELAAAPDAENLGKHDSADKPHHHSAEVAEAMVVTDGVIAVARGEARPDDSEIDARLPVPPPREEDRVVLNQPQPEVQAAPAVTAQPLPDDSITGRNQQADTRQSGRDEAEPTQTAEREAADHDAAATAAAQTPAIVKGGESSDLKPIRAPITEAPVVAAPAVDTVRGEIEEAAQRPDIRAKAGDGPLEPREGAADGGSAGGDQPPANDEADEGGPPENPGEFDETGGEEPSPLAIAIGIRWVRQARYAQDIHHATDTTIYEQPGTAIGLRSPMAEAIVDAYLAFVGRRLQDPGAPVEPSSLAAEVMNRPVVGGTIESMINRDPSAAEEDVSVVDEDGFDFSDEDSAFQRRVIQEVARATIMVQVDGWNRGSAMERDDVEFERIIPVAEEVAQEYGIFLDEVFAYPEPGQQDLYVEAFQRAYPGGPAEYVEERMRAVTQRGYAQTIRDTHNEYVLQEAYTMGFIRYNALNPTNSSDLSTEEYILRLLMGSEYDHHIQEQLEAKQRLAAAFTLAKIEEVWGPTASFEVPVGYQSWLTGHMTGSRAALPDEDRARLQQADMLRAEMITVAADSGSALSAEDVAIITDHAAIRMARIAALPDDDVIRIAHALDSLALTLRTDNRLAGSVDEDYIAQLETRLGFDSGKFNLTSVFLSTFGLHLMTNPATNAPYTEEEIIAHRASGLREEIVRLELRLSYPDLFAHYLYTTERDEYYDTRHFNDTETLVRRVAIPYFNEVLRRRLE